jgi:WhiB family redox-sensing transcriptional regulator
MPPQSLAQVPLDSKWHWQELGLCRGADPLLFFHTQNERGSSRSRRDQLAKRVCASCPVRLECADYAIRAREPYGVWGGLSEDDREGIFRQMDRSRNPRLASVLGTGVAAAKDFVNEAISE